MKRIYLFVVAMLSLGTLLSSAGAKAQFTVQTERIGTFMGELIDSNNVPVARRHVLGTDLGFTATWRGQGIMLFGDSIPSQLSPPAANVADLNHDDAWGFWSMPVNAQQQSQRCAHLDAAEFELPQGRRFVEPESKRRRQAHRHRRLG